jgi:chromosome segregation ATPase
MSEMDKTVVTPEKENVEVVEPTPGTPQEKATPEKSEEVMKLEAKKAELEEQVIGLEGTVESLKDDIVRKRQERKGIEGEEQQPAFDEEALLAKLDEKFNSRIQPVLEENEKLRKAVLKSNEAELKAKKQALDSINARIASAAASKASASINPEGEPEVELDPKEKEIAAELGLKNPRYMKEVEVL